MTIGLKAPEFGTRDYTTGRVYFITDGELIKIGYSGAPEARLNDLQTHSGRELEILKTIPGTYEDEKRLHTQFGHLRVRGEWFQSDPELLDFIAGRQRECASTVESVEPYERARDEFTALSKSEEWPPEVAMYFGSINCILTHLIEGDFDAGEMRQSLSMAVDGLEGNMRWWRKNKERLLEWRRSQAAA